MATETLDEQAIFEIARKIDAREAREAYLQQACSADAMLAERVRALLRAFAESESFLESPHSAVGLASASTWDPAASQALEMIVGPYKLVEQIGEGGMGTVYLAEQTQPVQRKVALKVIKAGMDSKQVIARFEAERQALAVMDHVNIARVFDAGTTENGLPYFVMELVNGVPITRYCDDNHLTPRERLELFVPVCQAIQHAHQKGIIHRDIKPTNVMVTLYDGKPVPKVIDFGVAKATEQKQTEQLPFTQYGIMIGTLEYMSPEQAGMSALGVDTRSDIYSLGVLLYELLTGSTPLRRRYLKEAAFAEIVRMIKEQEPPRPSTRLNDSGEALASISAQRKMEPAKLSKLVRGELDWIVMRALEKDRNRRYETANGLAVDVQRYLADETVQACPPSAWYRMRKSARRNKLVLSTASLIMLALVLGTATSTWQAIRARRNLDEANRQQSLAAGQLRETLLQQAIAQKNQALAETSHQQARQAVEQLFVLVGDDLVLNQPDFQPLRAKLLQTALGYYQQFIELWKDVPARRAELAASYRHVAQLAQQMGAQSEALSANRKALDLQQALAKEDGESSSRNNDLAATWLDLGLTQQAAGRHAEAGHSYDQALALWRALAEKEPAESRYQNGLAATLHNIGYLQCELNQPQQAVRYLRQALDLREKLVKEHPDDLRFKFLLAGTTANLANRLREAHQWDDALDLHTKSLNLFQALVQQHGARSDFERGIGRELNSIGDIHRANHRRAGWAEKALAAYAAARTIQDRLVREHPTSIDVQSHLANTLINTGQVYRARANYSEALQNFDAAIALLVRLVRVNPTGANDLSALGTTYCEKARALSSQGKSDDAAAAFRLAAASYEKLVRLAPNVTRYQKELAGFRQELERMQKKD